MKNRLRLLRGEEPLYTRKLVRVRIASSIQEGARVTWERSLGHAMEPRWNWNFDRGGLGVWDKGYIVEIERSLRGSIFVQRVGDEGNVWAWPNPTQHPPRLFRLDGYLHQLVCQ